MTVSDTLHAIRKTLSQAPQKPDLVAVSKRQPQEKIIKALEAGQRIFGENRVQEAYDHFHDLKQQGKYEGLKLHLIGPLQSNKAADAVALFDVIETIDRDKIARVLSQEMTKQNRRLPCYIQINTGEEPQKAGIAPRDLPDFLKACTQDYNLDIIGLMCIPPVADPPAVHFALLSKLAKQNGLTKLSMGMSADFDKAIALGATSVRLGTTIFGKRKDG